MPTPDIPADAHALGAAFELHAGPFGGRDLTVRLFRGREEISRLFTFEVVVSTALDAASVEPALLGQPASLMLEVPDRAPRAIRGVVAWVQPEAKFTADGLHRFRLRIVPRMWLLRRRRQSRIFQNMTVVQVVDAVLSQAGIERRWDLSGSYRQRAYCVQYEETDYAFVARLLAEEGIFFYFQHPTFEEASGGRDSVMEKVVFCDDCNYAALEIPPGAGREVRGPVVLYRDRDGLSPTREWIYELALRRTVRENAVTVRDFDFASPALNPTAQAAAKRSAGESDLADKAPVENPAVGLDPLYLESYEHHGEYEEHDVGNVRARQTLEQLRARAVVGRGASTCRRLLPGYRFTVEEHPIEELNRTYAIVRVDHEGRMPETVGASGTSSVEMKTSGRNAGQGRPQLYSNTFESVPVGVVYRPRRPRRQVRQVVETATVVGPEGKEIHTDTFGRVKVQFHWDREGKRNEHSSCWMRVAQSWAGAGWGSQFIPRIGMEVIVTFVGGDVDRPLVIGCVYNAHRVMPHAAPTRSGIRTESTPGGHGYNELMFEDAKGRELVYLRAQRDLQEEVERDHTITVGGATAAALGGNQRVAVLRDQTVEVGGSQSVTVKGRRSDAVGGDFSVEVEGDASIEVRGDRETSVLGTSEERIGESEIRIVEGDASWRVEGSAQTAVGGSQWIQVSGHRTVFAEGDASTSAKSYAVTAAETVMIDGPKSIKLSCGQSMIELLPEEIIITSKKVTVAATETAVVLAPDASLHLEKGKAVLSATDKAQVASDEVLLAAEDASLQIKSGEPKLVGKKVHVFSDKASLELDSDAALDGSQVKLNCKGGSDSAEEGDEPDELATSWIEIELADQDGAAVPAARYVIESSGVSYRGVLDAKGKARVPVRPGSCKVSFPDFDGPSWDKA